MPVRYLNVGDMFIEATPAFSLSKDSELLTSWGQDGIHLKNMYLLFDSQDRPINAANEYLIRHCCKVSDEAAFCLIQRPQHFIMVIPWAKCAW